MVASLGATTGGAYGNFGQNNHFADYVTLALISALYLRIKGRLTLPTTAVCAAIFLYVLSLSGSRSTWLYLVAALALSLWFRARTGTPRLRRAALTLAVLLPLVRTGAIRDGPLQSGDPAGTLECPLRAGNAQRALHGGLGARFVAAIGRFGPEHSTLHVAPGPADVVQGAAARRGIRPVRRRVLPAGRRVVALPHRKLRSQFAQCADAIARRNRTPGRGAGMRRAGERGYGACAGASP